MPEDGRLVMNDASQKHVAIIIIGGAATGGRENMPAYQAPTHTRGAAGEFLARLSSLHVLSFVVSRRRNLQAKVSVHTSPAHLRGRAGTNPRARGG